MSAPFGKSVALAVGMFASDGISAMDAIQTLPHELDCLLKAGHVQGACCSEQGI